MLCGVDMSLIAFLRDVRANGSGAYFSFVNEVLCAKGYDKALVTKRDDYLLHWFYTKKCYGLFPAWQVGKAYTWTAAHKAVDAFLKHADVTLKCH